jgi:hypothetical protein
MRQTPEIEAVRPFRLSFRPLRAHRRAREVTAQKLATLGGVGEMTFYRTEWGRRDDQVTIRELIAYSRALGVPVLELVEVIDE